MPWSPSSIHTDIIILQEPAVVRPCKGRDAQVDAQHAITGLQMPALIHKILKCVKSIFTHVAGLSCTLIQEIILFPKIEEKQKVFLLFFSS
jgi:hypothetical protein